MRGLAGIFDPSARASAARLQQALTPESATLVLAGPMRVAYTGPRCESGEPLCLLDGFLDNAAELARQLASPASSPPERLLAAGYRRWGRGLPCRLRGDFALLIWDLEQGEGLIARDQLGVRCLYLSGGERGGLSFASEIHQLLTLLPRRPAPDRASVAHWITASNRPGAGTLYEGVRRLNPGSMLLLDRHGAREERYWTPRFTEPLELSGSQLAHETLSALEVAVRRRTGPDTTTGVLMSGGLDSASVAAIAAIQGRGRVLAYAGVFPEHPAVDESELVAELRSTFALGGLTAQVRPGGLLASALESLAAWQMPLLGWSDFWTLPLLRAAAAQGVTVTLGGDGGDELFGPRVYVLADRLRSGHPLQTLKWARELPGAGDRPPPRQVARVLAAFAVSGALPYRLQNAVRPRLAARRLPRWLHPHTAQELIRTDDELAWKRLDGPRWWAHTAYGLTRGVEEAGVFEHQRRRAALAGLQARHPLFDLDLLELALRQPPRATLDRHLGRPVLRASMNGLLPDTVRLRPGKAWFDSLIAGCLQGPDGPAVRGLLSDPRAELAAYLDVAGMARSLLQGSHGDGPERFRWMHQVWRLLTAECWLRAQANPACPPLPDELKPSAAHITLESAPG